MQIVFKDNYIVNICDGQSNTGMVGSNPRRTMKVAYIRKSSFVSYYAALAE